MENQYQINERIAECLDLLEINRGKIITQQVAKHIYRLSKQCFKIIEYRLSDNESLVIMQRQLDNELCGDPVLFIVKGPIGNELNMTD